MRLKKKKKKNHIIFIIVLCCCYYYYIIKAFAIADAFLTVDRTLVINLVIFCIFIIIVALGAGKGGKMRRGK